jgi:hypothetical protein
VAVTGVSVNIVAPVTGATPQATLQCSTVDPVDVSNPLITDTITADPGSTIGGNNSVYIYAGAHNVAISSGSVFVNNTGTITVSGTGRYGDVFN